jgi:hypothetical protein
MVRPRLCTQEASKPIIILAAIEMSPLIAEKALKSNIPWWICIVYSVFEY